MKKQYFTLTVCALLFCGASALAQVGISMQNPVFAGNFSTTFTCPNTKNTTTFANNYPTTDKPPTKDVWYKFTLLTTMEITISHCGSALGDTYLFLLDASGNRIAYNNDTLTSVSGCSSSYHAYLKKILPAATYYVVSEGYSQDGEIKTTISGVASEFGYTEFPDTQSSSTKAVGGIADAFDVSPTGAAIYSIPIEAPLGVNGMQPNIAIIYNSQAGNGVVGYGANISGVSVITSVPKSIYYDGTAKGITNASIGNTNLDAYMLDGQRLIADPNAANTYYPESDPFTKIVKNGDQFDVQTKNGITYTYLADKFTEIANIKITNYYNLTDVKDLFGNYIKYVYNSGGIIERRYLSSIEYGHSSAVKNTITFEYENRSDVMEYKFSVFAPTRVTMSKRLSKITTKTGNNVFREYTLNYYVLDPFSRLKFITEKNGASEALNYTTLNWTYLPYFWVTAKTPNNPVNMTDNNFKNDIKSLTNVGDFTYSFISGDMNGDGLDDLIAIKTTKHQSGSSYFNGAHVYLAEKNNGNIKFEYDRSMGMPDDFFDQNDDMTHFNKGRLIADFDGDGINEFLIGYGNNSGLTFWCQTSTNKDTNKPKSVHVHINKDAIFTTADINNDGRSDIIIVEKNKLKIVKYDPSPSVRDFEENGTSYTINLSSSPKEVFAADFNGDGMVDIMAVYSTGYTIFWNNGGTFSNSDENKQSGTTIHNSTFNEKLQVMNRIGDFNGDGLPDFIYNVANSQNWYFALNNGNGTFDTPLQPAYEFSNDMCEQTFTPLDDNKFECLVYDFDFDGKSDVVIVKAVYEKGSTNLNGTILYYGINPKVYTYWLRSTGTGLEFKKSAESTNVNDAISRRFVVGDFDGDGKPEIMNYGYNCFTGDDTQQWRIYQNSSLTANDGKLTSVIDGFGNTTTINYGSLTNTDLYKKGSGSVYPLVDIQLALPVVNSVSLSNGTAGSITTNYTYDTARVHLQGKGFLGFKKITANNPTLGIKTETGVTSLNGNFYTPSETYTKTTTTADNKTAQTTVNYTYVDKLNKKYFAYPNTVTETDIYGNNNTTTYQYESTYGNITQEKTTFGNNDNYRQINYTDYMKAGGTMLNKPRKITVKQKYSNEDEFVNETYIQYDADYGYPTMKIENYGTSFALTTDNFQYDVAGNLTSYKVSGTGIGPITYNTGYDNTKRFVAQTTTNPASSIMVYTYDTWGNVLTEKDQTNSTKTLTTTHVYNNWGQRTETTLPTGRKMTITRGWGSNDDQKYFSLAQGTGMPWVKTWYDVRGRVTKTESIGAKDLKISATNTYNNKGQLTQTENKQGSLTLTDSYKYYPDGRLSQETKSSGQVINYAYANKQVTTTTNSRTYTKTFDVWGNVKTATDPGGTVTYTYYSHGNPKTINAAGATTTMEYDAVGRQKKLIDPNAGITQYEYNLLGQLKKQTDARGNITINYYDALNRLDYSTLNGVMTDYTYGIISTNNDYLRLNEIKEGNNSIKYVYDSYGDLYSEERFMDNASIYYVRYQRDSQTKKTYPYFYNPDFTVANGAGNFYNKAVYDAYGNLVKREATIYTPSSAPTPATWELTGNTGTQTTANIGNAGMTLTKGYDSKGFLNAQTTKKGTENILNIGYSFTWATGNLSSRWGILPSNSSEYFGYDNSDRLMFYNSNQDSYAMTHNTNGNILNKTNLGSGTYIYTYDSNHPHAIANIDNASGLVSTNQQDITYNAFNKVVKIKEGQYELDITYGPDRQRWKSVLKKNGITEKSIIFAPNYERVTNYVNGIASEPKHFYYIYGGDGLAAIGINEKVQNVQTTKIYYAHLDHLGSIVKLTDNNGNAVFAATYDAWGKQTPAANNTFAFHRGYKGHEHLPQFGLINMNGRMYDPLLGRMLSPDNYVQSPFNTQSYNRYSYCLNNPLKYTDPTGEKWWHWALGALGFVDPVAAITTATSMASTVSLTSSDVSYEIQKYTLPFAVKSDFRFGSNQGGIGIDASFGLPQMSPLSYRVHGGATYFWHNEDLMGNDLSGWETRYGGEWGISFTPNLNYTYSGTTFNSNWSGKQTTNTHIIGNPFVNVKYENDMYSGGLSWIPGVPEGSGDEYRTAAVQMNVGPFGIGTNMITGYGGPNKTKNALYINGHWTYVEDGEYNPNSHRNGIVYFRAGPFRLGWNSEKNREIFQNRFAHDLITDRKSKWYEVLSLKSKFYWQFGYSGGGTLY